MRAFKSVIKEADGTINKWRCKENRPIAALLGPGYILNSMSFAYKAALQWEKHHCTGRGGIYTFYGVS
jgi:hypothetical protein